MVISLRRYLVLCPAYSTEEGAASDYLTLRETAANDPRLGDIPDHQDLLTIFTTEEVTGASALMERYQKEIAAQVCSLSLGVVCGAFSRGQCMLQQLRKAVVHGKLLSVSSEEGVACCDDKRQRGTLAALQSCLVWRLCDLKSLVSACPYL